MEIGNYKEELLLLKKLSTSTDKNGKPMLVKITTTHTMKVNPNLEPALLVTLLNYVPKMCNADEPCMTITTTEFALVALAENKAKEYNIFIRQVNTLIDRQVSVSMYKMAKENKREIVLPDFEFFFGEIANYGDTDYIDKDEKKKYTSAFVKCINECTIQNGLQNLKTPITK